MAVSAIVLAHGGDEEEAIAALLHDAAKDQGGHWRLDDIRRRFGDEVANIVEACSDSLTDDSDKKAPWRERKATYHAHLQAHPEPSVYIVSAADKLHNARATQAEGPAVWSSFNAGKDDSLWNYRELITIYKTCSNERVKDVATKLEEVVSTR